MSLIVLLVLSRNIIVGGNINPSAATVRKQSRVSFQNPKCELSPTFDLFAPMIFLASYQKILGFRPYYLSEEMDIFLSLKIWRIQNEMMIFYFQVGMRVFDTKMFFFRIVKLCLSLN